MKIPKTVFVGAHELEIIFKDEENHGYTKWGSCQLMQNRIVLNKDLAPSKMEATLFHEVFHEINAQYCIELSEKTVDILSESIYDFLKRNKFLK